MLDSIEEALAIKASRDRERTEACFMFNRDELPAALKVSQVAKLLQIANSEAYKLVNSKAFPVLRIGQKAIRIPRDAFLAWVEKNLTV